jgi:enoyl-[acyl-carrier-protein] reductase (NADH)
MDLQLAGKRALVTGSSSGIGAGIAEVLGREGAVVVVHGRDRARAERVAGAIRAAGGTAHLAIGDLANDAGAATVAEAALDQTGGLDILVNNIGGLESLGGGPRGWFDVRPEQWDSGCSRTSSERSAWSTPSRPRCASAAGAASSTSPAPAARSRRPTRPTTAPPRPGC